VHGNILYTDIHQTCNALSDIFISAMTKHYVQTALRVMQIDNPSDFTEYIFTDGTLPSSHDAGIFRFQSDGHKIMLDDDQHLPAKSYLSVDFIFHPRFVLVDYDSRTERLSYSITLGHGKSTIMYQPCVNYLDLIVNHT